jgi:hypothetical protein
MAGVLFPSPGLGRRPFRGAAALVAGAVMLVSGPGGAVTGRDGPDRQAQHAQAATATLNGVAALSPADVWAVGNASTSSGSQPALIEHWNGRAWTGVFVNPGRGARTSTLYGVSVVSAKDVWAVGYSTSGPGQVRERTLVEHWNGRTWAKIASPSPGAPRCQYNILFAVSAVSASDVWADGYACHGHSREVGTLVEHWNGHTWQRVASPSPGGGVLFGIDALSASNVWAVGNFQPGSSQLTLTEHWNGHSWQRTASPTPPVAKTSSLEGAGAASAGDVWAVGYAQRATAGSTLTERWNGHTWQRVASPSPGGGRAGYAQLDGVAATSARNAWAVGYSSSASSVNTLAERWNGRAWRRTRSPDGGAGGALDAVTAVSADDVWAVGQSLTRTLVPSPLALRWNGRTWQRIPVPLPA